MTGPLLAADLVTLLNGGHWGVEPAERVLRRHGIRRCGLTAAASGQLRDWAARIRAAFAAEGVDERCRAVNALLAEGTTTAYLTTHDRRRPHLHFTPEQGDVVARVKAVTAGGLAIFTVESEGARLGLCRGKGCHVAFADTSRNGRRAYCSARCGNRDAVRRFRAQNRPV